MFPLSYDLQLIQGIEMYRDVLYSQFTFQLINNKLRVFPIPTTQALEVILWFQYLLKIRKI